MKKHGKKAMVSVNPQLRLLLLSSSRTPGTAHLQHARAYLRGFLRGEPHRVLFVPYARVIGSHALYLAQIRPAFAALGCELTSMHACADPVRAIAAADVLVVGGGNTLQLLHQLYALNLMDAIRRHVAGGMPYIGWSAGSNLACPTIRTTNDMPVIWPTRCEALGLVPFQINPHYTDAHPPGHQGEKRAERLVEFTRLNPRMPVVGLREGSALQVEAGRLRLLGRKRARIFLGKRVWDVTPQKSLQFLLHDVTR